MYVHLWVGNFLKILHRVLERELKRITKENQSMLQRIQTREPYYNHKKWEEEREQVRSSSFHIALLLLPLACADVWRAPKHLFFFVMPSPVCFARRVSAPYACVYKLRFIYWNEYERVLFFL